MFKKLVTNLPYSPGLINQIGFYAGRLKKEEFVRRISMIFAVLALLLNLNLSIFAPEASVLASPGNDVVVGGIYGKKAKNMQDKVIQAIKTDPYTAAVYDYYGISEEDIRGTHIEYISTDDDSFRSVGRQSFGRGAEACFSHNGFSFCEKNLHSAYAYRSQKVKALSGTRSDSSSSGDSWFSIIESCGNIVVRIGKKEDIRLKKSLAPKQDKTVSPGDTVEFRLTLSSLNKNGALYPEIVDTLPEHTEYIDHTPKDLFEQAELSGNMVTLSSNSEVYGLGPEQSRTISVFARVAESAPTGTKLCNSATASSQTDTAVSDRQACVTVAQKTPVPECVGVRHVGLGGTNTTRTFEATFKADGADITGVTFDYGDGSEPELVASSSETTSTTHTFTPGNYTLRATAQTSVGEITSPSCKVSIQVDEPAPEPVVACDYLRAFSALATDLNWSFEASATPENGATIEHFVIDFGDGSSTEIANTGFDTAQTTHSYSTPGIYTANVVAKTSIGDVTNDATCQTTVDIEETPTEPATCTEDCESIIKRKSVSNVSQNIVDADGTTAAAGDLLDFVLSIENNGTAVVEDFALRDDFADVLQYANIVSFDDGFLVNDGLSIEWPLFDIAPSEVVEKTIRVEIKSPIPNTPISESDPLAFDLAMENAFGNNVRVNLPSSTVKQVESVVKELPNTGPGLNAAVSTLFIGLTTYFYFRNRLISKELTMIKNEFSGGALST